MRIVGYRWDALTYPIYMEVQFEDGSVETRSFGDFEAALGWLKTLEAAEHTEQGVEESDVSPLD